MIEVILTNGIKFTSDCWKMSFHGIELTRVTIDRLCEEEAMLHLENKNREYFLPYSQIGAIVVEKEK